MSKVDELLCKIKGDIKDYHLYFKDNFERYDHFMRFVFHSSLSADDISLMQELGKPQLEFNILEPHISRKLGEFSRYEPAFSVRQADGVDEVDPQLIEVVESSMRAILFDSNRDNMEYDVFKEVLGGGFSGIRVYTEYASDRSFHQNIKLRKVYDPTLTGFDKLARASHKGDGNYAYELYPKSREDFESEYGKKYTEKMSFTRELGGFNWSFVSEKGKEIVLVGDFFKKKTKEGKIVQLIDGRVMTDDEYQENIERWKKQTDVMVQIPGIVGKPRKTKFTTIEHYIICENDILLKEDTDYKYLPIIFVDGNSAMIKRDNSGPTCQMTRPYVYHAEGIQKLKNFSGITLANELESMVQSRFMASKESIPAEYKDGWMEPQKPSILIYNSFKDDNPDVPLQMPQVIPRSGAPPEIMSTFGMSDEMTQSILGNYDAMQGNNLDGRLSGIAIKNGATQSNTASMPYNIGYMKAWQRVSEIILDLLPKYYTLPRSIAVQDKKGKRGFQKINQDNHPVMEYDSSSLEVKVAASVNFEIQRQEALDTLQGLMKTSPAFSDIIGGTAEGCEMILSNLDVRGIDSLKEAIPKYFQEKAQSQEQQQQMASQMNPMVIKQAEIKMREEKNQMDYQTASAKIEIEQQQSDTDRLLALNTIGVSAEKNELESAKIQAEESRTAVDAFHKMATHEKEVNNHKHAHAMDILKMHHSNKPKQQVNDVNNEMQ